MEPNPMLEEVWHVKDEWARAAGEDIHRLWQYIRQWPAEYSHPRPAAQNGEQPRRLAAEVADSGRMLLWSFEFASQPFP
jgi:hypothetical protein